MFRISDQLSAMYEASKYDFNTEYYFRAFREVTGIDAFSYDNNEVSIVSHLNK